MSRASASSTGATDAVFLPVSFVGFPLVLLMLVAPRARLTRRLVSSNLLVAGLAGLYAALVARGIVKNPASLRTILSLDLDGIVAWMGQRDNAVTVWTHMTTCDFFIARWIYLDSLERGRPARLALLTQFVAGPIGLLSYLAFSRRGSERDPLAQ